MSRKGSGDTVRIVQQFMKGTLSSEECFCMILSLLGEEKTKHEFHNILRTVSSDQCQNVLLVKELSNIYTNYFASLCVVNEQQEKLADHAQCFGEQLDLELALALSTNDTKTSSASHGASTTSHDSNKPQIVDGGILPSYASKLKSTEDLKIFKLSNQFSERPGSPVSDVPAKQKDQHIFGTESKIVSGGEVSKHKKKQRRTNQKQQGPMRHIHNKPVIYWLRRDLRLHDNPALVAAFEKNAPVVLAFLWNEEEEGALAAGGATKYWLHFALKQLDSSIQREYSNRILFRKVENSHREIKLLVKETGARTVVFNNLYEPWLKQRDDQISASLKSQGLEVHRFDSYLLYEPSSVDIESRGYRGFGSVLHFMQCCQLSPNTQVIGVPVDKPACLPTCASMPDSQPLEELGLARLPRRQDGTIIDWARVIRESWDFSEDGAWNAMDLFVDEGIRNYEKESGRADMPNTSRLSPYLHFGQVSPRAILRCAQGLKSPKFLRKFAWRDLSYWLLSKFPDMPSKPIRVHYQDQRWSDSKAQLKAWQKGQTGYPLVDAAMRQLWLTGWMNNYMRHVVASFLISYLHLHWVHGYNWFQDTLLDADVAINAMMWQNGGMSGLDQWNFVMHPVDAALTCDPKGQYVRQWCPELSALPDDFIHKPWKCPPSVLRRAGIELGRNYPHRILTDLEEAREQSLRDVVAIRLANPHFVDAMGNDLVPLPTGRLLPVITRREFKYKTANPEAKDNPHTAVLRGYRSRKRDEAIAFANQVDFTASTMNECALRYQRYEQSGRFIEL
ncbi:deoxyribodipyrimidine photo-lyase-like [Babylonia areolata]|uniref:deoxyribodipyrimidine photo-lyase-like n=1 Tax=Babylonia areolata TaxID=304850 RepID=UPI003FD6B0C5